MSRIILILVAFTFMASCTNETATIRYYKLASSSQLKSVEQTNLSGIQDEKKDKGLIVIEPIVLAEFLRRKGLVIQKNEHQIQISNIHRWAEELERAVSRVVRERLDYSLLDYRVEDQNSRWKIKPNYRISIELSQFHVNHESQTIASGQFWLFDKSRNVKVKRKFNFEMDLAADGYEHAISQLEKSLFELCELIVSEINLKE